MRYGDNDGNCCPREQCSSDEVVHFDILRERIVVIARVSPRNSFLQREIYEKLAVARRVILC